MLLEAAAKAEPTYSPAYEGIRTVRSSTTARRKYVEYEGGTGEFYRLNRDPYELTNVYGPTAPSSYLVYRLRALESCAGKGCRKAENGP